MNRIRAMGINWNNMDPFPRYGPYDFPVIVPAGQVPAYNFPVIQQPPVVVAPTVPEPANVPAWVYVGGAALVGLAVASLLTRK